VSATWADGSPRNDIEPPDPRLDWQAEREAYVTEVSVPSFGDNGVQRLHSQMPEPEPQPEPGPELEAGR
jgi:hypothetical protein